MVGQCSETEGQVSTVNDRVAIIEPTERDSMIDEDGYGRQFAGKLTAAGLIGPVARRPELGSFTERDTGQPSGDQ